MEIIARKEGDELSKINKWLLIYGRRKTGKTFLVENFLKWDDFIFVNRNKTLVSKKRGNITYEVLLEIITDLSNRIVIDEFHRLGQEFLDVLQRIQKSGQLILITSSLGISKEIFKPNSPILGFFAEFRFDIINLIDTLTYTSSKDINPITIIESAILIREPILLSFFIDDKIAYYSRAIKYSLQTIPSLVGEIFTEEERSLSTVYEGILRAIASGKQVSSEIANYLHKIRVIQRNDPSLVQPYLGNLISLGIIKRIRDLKKSKFYYFHKSPLLDLFYYGDEKYSISNFDIPLKTLETIIIEKIPKLVEINIREALSIKYGLTEAIWQSSGIEIDGILLRFKKPKIVIEVKWVNKITRAHLERTEQIFSNFKNVQKILITKYLPNFNYTGYSFEIWDAQKFIDNITSSSDIPNQ